MRGSDERTGSLFSFVDLQDRVPAKHPLRKIRQIVNEALATLDGEFSKLYARRRPTLDRARETASRFAPAGVLLDPFRAPADGTARLQSAVPLGHAESMPPA